MSIRIFVTGGTFDKEYNEITGQLFFKETHLPEMISRSRVTPKVIVQTLMMIDSLDMGSGERLLIAQQCNAAAENKIIITHGTDTMAVTATILAEKVPGKTIVLTGAMIPYKFGSSDGFFNLGCAPGVCTIPSTGCLYFHERPVFQLGQCSEKSPDRTV